jgi:hypothetical protein
VPRNDATGEAYTAALGPEVLRSAPRAADHRRRADGRRPKNATERSPEGPAEFERISPSAPRRSSGRDHAAR